MSGVRLRICLNTPVALATLFFLGSAPGKAQDPLPPSSPESLVEVWVAMWNSYDLDEVQRLFLDDGGITYFSSEKEGVIQGMEAVLEHHRGFDFVPGGQPKGTRLWVEDVTLASFGDTAVLTGIWYFQGAPPTEGEPQKGPVTFVCIRTGGGWKFVHMNFSTYLPESGG
jgi:ketosteroid isomerase-like protein